MSLSSVPTCILSESGTFKYVAIRATAPDGSTKTLIRGIAGLAYHADIFDATREQLARTRLRLEPLGGGRMRRHNDELFIYGYSQAYGRADHATTMSLVLEAMPSLVVSWSNDGY